MSLTEDPCSVKPNNTAAADQAPLDADHTISHLLEELKNFWKQLPDPMDERILTRLQDLCSLTQDTRSDLLKKYKILVNTAGDDFNQIADELIISTGDGHRALYWSIRGSSLAYRIAISRNTKAALSDISNAATDLVLLAENRKKQEIIDRSAMEHLLLTCKSMCADVTTHMEKVNTLNVDRSIATSRHTVQSGRSPSVDSGSANCSFNPEDFRVSDDTVYANTHLCVHVDQHGKLSLSPHSKTGMPLLGLNHISSDHRLIKFLLNRDLIELSHYIRTKKIDFTHYKELTLYEQSGIILRIEHFVPSKSRQWVLSSVD